MAKIDTKHLDDRRKMLDSYLTSSKSTKKEGSTGTK